MTALKEGVLTWKMMKKIFFDVEECDNRTNAHLLVQKPMTGTGGSVYFCKLCKHTYFEHEDKLGRIEKRRANVLFYREIVQRNKPLYFKIHRERMLLGNL